MSFPERFIAEVKARTDLAALCGQRVALKRKGREFVGLSPFQAERTPSFYVIPEKGIWHCFCTQRTGDCFDWEQEFNGLTFVEAVAALAADAGMDLPEGHGEVKVERKKKPALAPVAVTESDVERMEREEIERAKLFDVWRAALPIAARPAVGDYLAQARGLPEEVWRDIPVLRAARLPFWSNRRGPERPESLGDFPAMVAAIQGPDGRFAGLHITYVEPDGSGKLDVERRGGLPGEKPKKVRGKPQGGAIRLCAAEPDMGGGEGIESSLSVIAGTAFPVWALYSLGNWAGRQAGPGPEHPHRPGQRLPGDVPDLSGRAFVPPPIVRRFTWFADNDSKDPLAADALVRRGAARLRAMGLVVPVAMPPPGLDFNDVWREGLAEMGRAA